MTKKYADALKLCDIMLRFDSENELGKDQIFRIFMKPIEDLTNKIFCVETITQN